MDVIQTTFRHGIAHIRMNRPHKHHALNPAMIQGFIAALQQANQDKHIRLIVIDAPGRHFCAGADIAWLQAGQSLSETDNAADAKQLATLLDMLYTSPKVTVAYVQGKVLGGALGLISSCDMVIADPDAQFAAPETTLGMVPAIIAPAVCRKVGIEKARLLFLQAIYIQATTATTWGLVTEILPVTAFQTHQAAVFAQVSKTAPGATATTKQILRDIAKDTYRESHILMAKTRTEQEAQKGLQCFFDKTAPIWHT